jgi:D-alanyl-D-alanine carboxypeptidase (penicillin-binding protein 5/6)
MTRRLSSRLAVALLMAIGAAAMFPLGTPAASAPATRAASAPPASADPDAAADARVASELHLSVRAASLMEVRSGKELFAYNAYAPVPIASTTKLMTALITLEHERRLSRRFADPSYYPAASDSQIGLAPGERMSVHDLLLALLLPSADDAAEDLAYNVGRGSVARFIGMMNARAKQLGLHRTHYTTPIGLDTPGNYSTAYDLLKLTRYVLRTQPFFDRAVASPSAVLRTGNHVRYVTNRNDLVGRISWINGVKTGHTNDAGYVLVGSGTRRGMRLLSVVLGTSSESSRDENTLDLLDYGFANFRTETLVRRNEVLARPSIRDQPRKHAEVIAAHGFSDILPRSAHTRLRVEVPRQLAGPMPWHAKVGRVLVLRDGHVLARIPLLLAHRIPAVGTLALAARFVSRPSTLVGLVVLFAAAMSLAALRRSRRRSTRRRRVRREEAEAT